MTRWTKNDFYFGVNSRVGVATPKKGIGSGPELTALNNIDTTPCSPLELQSYQQPQR